MVDTAVLETPARRAIVAGHICLDVIPDFSHLSPGEFMDLFRPGHMVVTGGALFSTGGAVANTGLALHTLGIPVQGMGKLGGDPFGDIIFQLIEQKAPAFLEGIARDAQHSTSYTLIINPPGVDRIFLYSSGANDAFDAEDIDLTSVAQADLFHFGYPPLLGRMYQPGSTELLKIFQQVKQQDLTTSLDMTFPDLHCEAGRANWRSILTPVLHYVDLFTPSIEETLFMLFRPQYDRLTSRGGNVLDQLTPDLLTRVGDWVMQAGVKVFLLKLGEKGMYLRTASADALSHMGKATPHLAAAWAEHEWIVPSFETTVVGTTGAGDAAIAGFLAALLRGLPAQQAVTTAAAVGACCVEAPDALSGLRSWEATLQRVMDGWPRRTDWWNTHLQPDPLWQWNHEWSIWEKRKY